MEEDLIHETRTLFGAGITQVVVSRVARPVISEAIQQQHDCDKREVREVVNELKRCQIVTVVVFDFRPQLWKREHNQHEPEDEKQAGRWMAFRLVLQLNERNKNLN